MEQLLVPGEVKVSCRIVLVVGDTTVGVVDKVGRLPAVDIVMDDEALRVWSAGAEVKTGILRPPKAVTGIEACREEDGAEMLSEEVVLGAVAVVAQGAIEAGAETVHTGWEERDRVGQGGEAIPVKDSRLWDPSLTTAFSVLGD